MFLHFIASKLVKISWKNYNLLSAISLLQLKWFILSQNPNL